MTGGGFREIDAESGQTDDILLKYCSDFNTFQIAEVTVTRDTAVVRHSEKVLSVSKSVTDTDIDGSIYGCCSY